MDIDGGKLGKTLVTLIAGGFLSTAGKVEPCRIIYTCMCCCFYSISILKPFH